MNKIIHKYSLDWRVGKYVIELPVGIKILSIQNQRDTPVLYYLADVQAAKSSVVDRHKFVVLFTGYETHNSTIENGNYLGTVMLENGQLVVHYFHCGIIDTIDRKIHVR